MILDRFERVIPGKILRTPKARAVFASLFAIVDGLVDYVRDAVAAGRPGQVDGAPDLGGHPDVDALPVIGRDRGLVQGPAESPGDFASACRKWRLIRAAAGTNWGLLRQVQRVLGPVRVRLVSDHGYWWTLEADGAIKYHTPTGVGGFEVDAEGASAVLSTAAHPWDWDGATAQGDTWLIVYCQDLIEGVIYSDGHVYGASGPETTSYGSGAVYGLDLGATAEDTLNILRETIRANTAGGQILRFVIFTFDAASFDPETPGPYPAADMPDGLWGKPWKVVGGVAVPSRATFARYWDPEEDA